jgi:predicted acyltransferase
MTQRYYSLDIFRGATVAFMILVNNPGTWSYVFSPLKHAAWHGITPTDLVFPFFLFAVGNAMAFVIPKLQEAGPGVFWTKVIRRTLLIFIIGLLLNWFPFVRWHDNELVIKGWTWINNEGALSGIRILGVLQRIALCYLFASVIIYYTTPRGAVIISAVLLFLYWILCVIGNPNDPYSLQGWVGTAIDKSIFGPQHMYHGEGIAFDPEGIVSTLPAIVEVIAGYLVGYYLLRKSLSGIASQSVGLYHILTTLFVAASALMFIGYAWDFLFPINKKIWTSSYVLLTSGLAISVLSILVYLIEVKNYRSWWMRFFEAFGKNPLFIYVLSGVIVKLLSLIRIDHGVDETGKQQFISPWSVYYDTVDAIVPGPPELSSFIVAISFVVFLWVVAYVMDKKRVYIRV